MLPLLSGSVSWLAGQPLRVPSQQRGAASVHMAEGMVKVFIDGEAGTTGLEVRNPAARRYNLNPSPDPNLNPGPGPNPDPHQNPDLHPDPHPDPHPNQVRNRLAKRSDVELITLNDVDRKDAKARAKAFSAADAAILCLPDDAAIEAVTLCEGSDCVLIDASTAHRINPEWAYGFPELNSEQVRPNPNPNPDPDPDPDPDPTPNQVASAVSGYSGGGKALMGVFEGEEPHF